MSQNAMQEGKGLPERSQKETRQRRRSETHI